MINNKENKIKTQKKSVVITPDYVGKSIYNSVKRYPFKNILDVGSWDGALSNAFRRKHHSKIIGLDITDEFSTKFDHFIHKDFLECSKKDFIGLNIDLVVMNPPFGKNKRYGDLYPNLFIKKVFEIFGDTMPVVMIAGHWFLSNSNNRMQYLNNANITRITTLHKGTFKACGVEVEADILYFNIKQKTSVDFLKVEKTEKKQRFKTVAFSDKQMKFIKENIENFSGEIKKLISKEYENFPM